MECYLNDVQKDSVSYLAPTMGETNDIGLKLSIYEFVEAITNDHPALNLAQLLRWHPVFCQSRDLLKAFSKRLHSASAESNEERRKIIALRTGSSIRICIEYLWKCDLDLLYYGDTVLLLTDVVEEFKPFGMYSVMHSSLTNTLQRNHRKLLITPQTKIPRLGGHEADSVKHLWEISLEEIARQIALMDSRLFLEISGLSLVHAIKRRRSAVMECEFNPIEQKTQSITIFRSHLAKLTKMVIGSILESNTAEEFRAKIERFHQLAQHLLRMDNLSSFFAVSNGIQSSYVKSLSVIMGPIDETYFLKFNLKRYRKNLKNVSPPAIPPIDHIWKMIEKICLKDSSDANKIDFQAMLDLNEALKRELESWQQYPYNFETVTWLQEKIIQEENLYSSVSLIDQYKVLRSKLASN